MCFHMSIFKTKSTSSCPKFYGNELLLQSPLLHLQLWDLQGLLSRLPKAQQNDVWKWFRNGFHSSFRSFKKNSRCCSCATKTSFTNFTASGSHWDSMTLQWIIFHKLPANCLFLPQLPSRKRREIFPPQETPWLSIHQGAFVIIQFIFHCSCLCLHGGNICSLGVNLCLAQAKFCWGLVVTQGDKAFSSRIL